ncbi:hypothetical protein [Burkholderia ubonensis]|nr:hypothetical protein [Burkholderia ubonensis]
MKAAQINGDANAFTEEVLSFPDTPAGRMRARVAIEALLHLSIEHHFSN